MTSDMKPDSVDNCASSNNWYLCYLCWNTFRSKWWNSFLCSPKADSLSRIWCTNMTRQLRIFAYSPSTYRLSVLNIDPKHYSFQVFWHTIFAGNCLEMWRATSDDRIYGFDIQLNCAENGLKTRLATTQERRSWRSICDKWAENM